MAKNNNKTQIQADISKSREKNIKYWQDRAVNNFLAGEKDALQVARHLKNVYNEALKEIDKTINAFYGKYATETGLNLEEAQKLLNKNELKDFKSYIDKMLKMGEKENFSSAEMFEFRRLYNKAKITRLEELQANIRGELDKLAVTTVNNVGTLLENSYEEGYYKTVYDNQHYLGIASSFSNLNTNAIEKAVTEKYQKANYSDRIWLNTNKLMQTLTQEIPKGLVLGYNPRKLAKQVDKKLNINYNNTVRLIRTEYAHILNEATLSGYKASGVDKYQILAALDERTCNDCGDLDGTLVPINKGEPGINLPPFHPNCRCTTIPYFEPDEFDIDEYDYNYKYDIELPLNITYKEWKENLTQPRNGKIHYKGGE